MKNSTTFRFLLLLISAVTWCCVTPVNDEEEEVDFGGSKYEIENFIGKNIYEKAVSMGFIFNVGSNPPNVEGIFLADSLQVLSTLLEGDFPGNPVDSQHFVFSNQNNDAQSVFYFVEDGFKTGKETQGFISGHGPDFTVMLKVGVSEEDFKAKTVYLITGTVVDQGILSYQLAVFMIDDGGAPKGIFIPEGSGRVIHDADDLADKI